MHFHTIKAFVGMGGYGYYVWLAFGLVFIVLAIQMLIARARFQRLIQQLQQDHEA